MAGSRDAAEPGAGAMVASTAAASVDRLVLSNFKSVGNCDVRLGRLTFVVGRNGSGKSNFLDSLHFVRDALTESLEVALKVRYGLNEVRRRSSGHPTHFGIRLDLTLPDERSASYAFRIGALSNAGYEVQQEHCTIDSPGRGPSFQIDRGKLRSTSETTFPSITADRLALVAASGLQAFRPVYDALASMRFFSLNPKVMREPQKPQDARALMAQGENIASVLAALQRDSPPMFERVVEYLRQVVPIVDEFERAAVGPMETIQFRQKVKGAKHPWKFYAQNMSDGTLRALGILIALFHGHAGTLPTLVGIEEPETALHPGATAILRHALRDAATRSQVIVTSHSPELLNDPEIDPESILIATMIEGDTRIAPLDQATRKTIQEHLFTAGELLGLDQLQPSPEALRDVSPSQQPDLFSGLA